MSFTVGSVRRQFLKGIGGGGALLFASQFTQDDDIDEEDDDGYDADREDELDPPEDTDVDRIAADPTDVPDPVDWDEPRRHEITMTSEEHVAEVEPGVTFRYMTFDGQVPAPLIRVRRGDTVHLTFEVPDDLNVDAHNVDFHAVYGPGGGAEDTTLAPGDDPAEIEFSAEYPGIFIYHCAVPNMDQHISAGMFGAILVEPEDGLPEVDRELYFGQHELYTNGDPGQEGHHQFDFGTMADEDPTYVLTNGEAYAYAQDGPHGPVDVEKGERIRIFFANGGPNMTCSWHAIGNVWETYYRDGSFTSEPDRYVETTPVAPGTVTAAEIETPVPGPIHLVDHALSRVVRKGNLATLEVDGEAEPDIYNPDP
ncbi:copper-containing nitrite reductase [Natrialbaceae archaeon A-CW3]